MPCLQLTFTFCNPSAPWRWLHSYSFSYSIWLPYTHLLHLKTLNHLPFFSFDDSWFLLLRNIIKLVEIENKLKNKKVNGSYIDSLLKSYLDDFDNILFLNIQSFECFEFIYLACGLLLSLLDIFNCLWFQQIKSNNCLQLEILFLATSFSNNVLYLLSQNIVFLHRHHFAPFCHMRRYTHMGWSFQLLPINTA